MRVLSRFLLIALGLFVCMVCTLAVFGLPIGPSLTLLAEGSFGDKFAASRMLVKTVPLLITGLGIVVAWKGGMYNVGGEGQFIVGGIVGAFAAKLLCFGPHPAPPLVATIGILIAATAGGGFYGWFAGVLYTKRGIEVVISTILLNFIGMQVLDWIASGPLQEAARHLPQTELLPDAVMLPKLDRQTDIHAGIPIAILAAVLVYVYLYFTKGGFQLRLVGANPRAARANLVSAPGTQERAMLISGALCGLAGGIEYTAIAGQVGSAFSQNWGFLAIPVALLGGLHPLAVILSAIFFGILFAGSEQLARFTPAGTTLVFVIQAVAVLGFVALNAWQQRRMVVQEAL